MLSYQWDHQAEVKKVRDALERLGFKVWMDIAQMSGDMYKKMAEGVEGSNLMIACMSSKYQLSENCNREFQYAQEKKRTIIPIKVERGFNATGALGLIVAGKLYIDFSNTNFDANMISLQKEIESHLSQAPGKSNVIIYIGYMSFSCSIITCHDSRLLNISQQ